MAELLPADVIAKIIGTVPAALVKCQAARVCILWREAASLPSAWRCTHLCLSAAAGCQIKAGGAGARPSPEDTVAIVASHGEGMAELCVENLHTQGELAIRSVLSEIATSATGLESLTIRSNRESGECWPGIGEAVLDALTRLAEGRRLRSFGCDRMTPWETIEATAFAEHLSSSVCPSCDEAESLFPADHPDTFFPCTALSSLSEAGTGIDATDRAPCRLGVCAECVDELLETDELLLHCGTCGSATCSECFFYRKATAEADPAAHECHWCEGCSSRMCGSCASGRAAGGMVACAACGEGRCAGCQEGFFFFCGSNLPGCEKGVCVECAGVNGLLCLQCSRPYSG